jgi:hypothetical protein
MSRLRLLLLIALAVSYADAQATRDVPFPNSTVPVSCSVTTRPTTPYIPPPPFDKIKMNEYSFWFGTDRLFIVLNDQMTWIWQPRAPGHEKDEYPRTTKLFFYRAGYNPYLENFPKLTVKGRRLDGPAPPLEVDEASNALGQDGTGVMVTAFYVVAPGCWEINGDYHGDKLTFVVWVTPEKPVEQLTAKH